MNKRIVYGITTNNITVNYDGQTHIVSREDPLADKLLQALREGRKEDIPELVSASKRIENYGQGSFVVKDGVVHVNGQPVHDGLSRKILAFRADRLPHEPLVRFAGELQKNPSFRAVNELFQFLEKNDHPITEEGNFIAYKRVRGNFTDIHSGTFDNSVGKTVEMPRNQVNENSAETCSNGLHVANWDYAHNQFASSDSATDVMLEVEVSPADVVSIPVDYNQAKMRVCKYKVLGVVDEEHSSSTKLRNYTPPPVVQQGCCDGCGCSDSGEAEYEEDEKENEEEDVDGVCRECGELTDIGYTICEDCETSEDNSSSDDEYPWEDELK